ncbi:MAG TPA: lipid-A-disaccharide synthase [Candidatus Polarisedimenticolia bacterium]|jgi:lipid-A-disaccharide synthase|nr:lipid-A-disaccharide synthase [Candidatus Polarisedimenticolia bacterium]
MTRPARVLIVAGEASGDLYGGLIQTAMRERAASSPVPPVVFTGIGGDAMRAAGLDPLADAAVLGVTGIVEVAARFGAIWKAFRAASRVLADPATRPDLAILIDYPDFNLRLAARARDASVPVLYFVSPQVWAWRRGRVRRMAGLVDRMLVILPFEEAIYREAGVPVTFVGHPLLDLVRTHRNRRQERARLGLDPDRPVVALLPGSRRNEVATHLPPMLEALATLRSEFRDVQSLLTVAPTRREEEIRALARAALPGQPLPVLVREDRYDAVAAADAAVVASGTATLETALLGTPMVIVYRMNPMTYALARRLTDLPHVGMPNLIAGRRVVPELIQDECQGPPIARALRELLTDPARAEAMRRDLQTVRARLGEPGAIGRAAHIAWDMIAAARGGAR